MHGRSSRSPPCTTRWGGNVYPDERVLAQKAAQHDYRLVMVERVVSASQRRQRPVRAAAEYGQTHRRASRVQR
jgi:hypothetical protein